MTESTRLSNPLADLLEAFQAFDDWEERYALLIDLGHQLSPFPPELQTEENFVKGCVSQVWMVLSVENGILHLQADSDGQITKGLVALLVRIYDGISLDEARRVDILSFFKEIGLDQHLTPNRRNGFYAMVERVKKSLI
ncbi:MAG: hypothetical protein GC136_03655 [Alphaproteobacteria bacterium]|nr:hypothetical protein [Alphaproteobacteria bacterium]